MHLDGWGLFEVAADKPLLPRATDQPHNIRSLPARYWRFPGLLEEVLRAAQPLIANSTVCTFFRYRMGKGRYGLVFWLSWCVFKIAAYSLKEALIKSVRPEPFDKLRRALSKGIYVIH